MSDGQESVAPARRSNRGCLYVFIGVPVAIGIATWIFGTGDTDRNAGVVAVCEQFMSDRLRSPGSADFQTADFDRVSDLGGDRYRYSAFVDSENGLGALLRTNFTCEVRHIDGNNYRLIDLSTD